jgi:hypothetical protein
VSIKVSNIRTIPKKIAQNNSLQLMRSETFTFLRSDGGASSTTNHITYFSAPPSLHPNITTPSTTRRYVPKVSDDENSPTQGNLTQHHVYAYAGTAAESVGVYINA